jgi:arginyl-tRNA synthetase
MQHYRMKWQQLVFEALKGYAKEKGRDQESFTIEQVIIERPPDSVMGDIAFPMFSYAKLIKESPNKIAEAVAARIKSKDDKDKIHLSGSYLNVKLDRQGICSEVIKEVAAGLAGYGKSRLLHNKRIILEFSCPNTNKPLHLGHLRNDALGESLARIFKACGAEVFKVNLINDRGIHICKSMLAYQEFGAGRTPLDKKVKGDHFVGDFYVKFGQWAKEDTTAEEKARVMLKDWENGDKEVWDLWERMNRWAIKGIEETYRETGIGFDKIYYESQTFSRGKQEVLAGLEKGVFFKKDDDSIWADLKAYDLDEKVLLRSDGTSLYLTQDIGTALERNDDWPFDQMIYVVASEQNYHFKVLFKVLELLGYPWAKQLYHLSYGMVNLPEGKMKSREGTVVDADDLLADLKKLALQEIKERQREQEIEDPETTAKKISLAALNYYLLQVLPQKEMIFDPRESISFNGNTGPYLQYSCARISSMLKKYEERKGKFKAGKVKTKLFTVAEEWEIIKMAAEFPAKVEQAAKDLNPSIITAFLYELAKLFSRYYHDNPVLHNENPDLVVTRIALAKTVLQTMKNGFELLAIPFLEKM